MSCQDFFFTICLTIFFNRGEMMEPSYRIHGGENATIEDFPYMAYFRHSKDGYVCSGTIISKDHILATGACVMTYIKAPFQDVIVITGTNNLINKGNEHMISYTSVHPEFFKTWDTAIRFDFAVVTLCYPLAFNEINQKPIALPTNPVKEGERAVVTGWGFTEDNEKSDILQKLHTRVYTLKKCAEMENIPVKSDDNSRICTMNEIGQGICEHDNGAPLVVKGVLVGIASLRHECASGRKDLFAYIYTGLNFIQGEMNPEICS